MCICGGYCENTCFPSGSLEFWYLVGKGCLWDYLPIGTGLQWAFLNGSIKHMLLYFQGWGKSRPCVTSPGRKEHKQTTCGFLQIPPGCLLLCVSLLHCCDDSSCEDNFTPFQHIPKHGGGLEDPRQSQESRYYTCWEDLYLEDTT